MGRARTLAIAALCALAFQCRSAEAAKSRETFIPEPDLFSDDPVPRTEVRDPRRLKALILGDASVPERVDAVAALSAALTAPDSLIADRWPVVDCALDVVETARRGEPNARLRRYTILLLVHYVEHSLARLIVAAPTDPGWLDRWRRFTALRRGLASDTDARLRTVLEIAYGAPGGAVDWETRRHETEKMHRRALAHFPELRGALLQAWLMLDSLTKDQAREAEASAHGLERWKLDAYEQHALRQIIMRQTSDRLLWIWTSFYAKIFEEATRQIPGRGGFHRVDFLDGTPPPWTAVVFFDHHHGGEYVFPIEPIRFGAFDLTPLYPRLYAANASMRFQQGDASGAARLAEEGLAAAPPSSPFRADLKSLLSRIQADAAQSLETRRSQDAAVARARKARSAGATLGAAGLVVLAVSWGIYLYRQASRRGELLLALREALRGRGGHVSTSEDPRTLWQRYLAARGSPDALEPIELAAVLGDEPPYTYLEAITPAKLLALARLMESKGGPRRAAVFVTDAAIAHAGASETEAAYVLRLLDADERLDADMHRALLRVQTPAFYTSYAKCLAGLGRRTEALAVLLRKPKDSWTANDGALALELHVQLGNAEQAEFMLERILAAKPAASDPAFYFALGRRAEETGKARLAARLFGAIVDAGARHQDAAQRFARLTALLETQAAEAARAGQVSASFAAQAPARVPPPQPGTDGILGRKYVLRGQLGAGGMGIVLDGFDRDLSRRVAIKRLRAELKDSARERSNFLREARLIAALSHPYIVNIHDVLEEGGEVYLVFEYVDGRPLSKVLEERGKLPFGECVKVMNHVCQAVAYAHGRKVVHRDLKPANVMVDASGFARVMDFGLARELKDALSRLSNSQVSGTPGYMAPEQHLGITRKESDVFAMGCTVFEILTGMLPYQGPDFLAQKERMLFPRLTSFAPGLKPDADAFMADALAPDPKNRIADPLLFLERLRALA
ncbi:MAG: serine/threonine protein kinase [Proteobacteria bacterium]|nr:serine/threonine protein kinase [Pseudomonadota bacterium]